MFETPVERIITRDNSSGMHHVRIRINGKTYTQEADNLDASGEYTVVDGPPETGVLWCERCFPEIEAHPQPEGV